MREHRVFGVEVPARRGRGPDVIGREDHPGRVDGPSGQVIVDLVRLAGGRGVRDVAPGRAGRDACGQGDVALCAVPEDFSVQATQGEDGVQEDEGEVAAGAVAGEDYVRREDGGVEGSRGWVDQSEVGEEGVEEGGGEGVLGRESVADGETATVGEFGEFLAGSTMRDWVHCIHIHISLILLFLLEVEVVIWSDLGKVRKKEGTYSNNTPLHENTTP